MAISGLQTINVGVENQATGSDSLFVAFGKTQNNFALLANLASPYNTFAAGNGIGTLSNSTSGVVTIRNTGVINIVAGTGITATETEGNVTLSVSGYANGTLVAGVTNVGIVSSTLTVGNSPVISNGIMSVNLPVTGITAGEYIAPTMTVDTYGRVTAITNTTSIGTVTSVGFTPGEGIDITGGPIIDDGVITITNTGVTRLTAGPGILMSGNTGDITIYSSNPSAGSVTSVEVTSNTLTITGGAITTSGAINIEMPETDSMTGNFSAGNLTSNSALLVLGNANVVGTFRAGGASTLVGNLLVTANANVTGNVVFGGTTTSTGNLSVSANANVVGNLLAGGTITSTGNLLVSSSANVVGNAVIGGILTSTGNLLVTANANITGNVTFGGITTSTGNLLVTANANITGNALFGGIATITGVLNASANANITGNLNVTANANVTGNINTVANVSANNISVTRNLTVGNSTLGNISSFDVNISNAAIIANTGYLMLNCVADNSKFVALQGPATMSAAYTVWQLPSQDGPAGNAAFMSTNGAGVLSFTQPASSSAPSTSGSAGIAGQIAYDNTHIYVCIATDTWIRADAATW